MTASLFLVIAGAVLVAAGLYLFLERSLMRILAGLLLAGNGVNLLFMAVSGPARLAPFVEDATDQSSISDPLPQAMVLTAIVISLATCVFLLALSYRSFQLDGHDEVADDIEDAIVRRRAEADLTSATFDEAEEGVDHDTDLAEAEAEAEAAAKAERRDAAEAETAEEGEAR
ncbi:MAG TPA: Na(+)/H(+) antiporter subunit C [Candidatus Agrococcus pullicola]|uniref:Na(+)/H(+) antiporter subunit C n=1 Tax=Candidatus Agrococcus pullicola TaxID=2838429 RepID=A0A9D1YSN1_9MICO|nr:Na(+)/H(+) antiporter subunit C [Candidatus Agrococcus pullicola]